MAEFIFTSRERKRIDTVAFEFGEIIDEFFEDIRRSLTDDEWRLLTDYASARVRTTLELGPLLHALVDRQTGALPYPGRGRETFVRAALAAWRDSFAPIRDAWKLVSIFEKVDGGERRILADVATLEVMAGNRMFTSLDDQCAALLTELRE